MDQNTNQKGPDQAPLGRFYRLEELPGWWSKQLPIPAGRLGVVIYPGGSLRTFPSGEPVILSAIERLQGKGMGLQAGYVPAVDLKAGGGAAILSGDGELLDVRVVCSVQVADPGRFFTQTVIPRGVLYDGSLELEPQPVRDALAGSLGQYAAADLLGGQLDARLLAQLQPRFGPLLTGQGLRLTGIQLLALSRASDRALIAEKAQALKERLQETELKEKMAAIETQAQLDEFIQQFAPGLGQVARPALAPVAGAQPASAATAGGAKPFTIGKVTSTIRSWLGMGTLAGEKSHATLEQMYKSRPAPAPRVHDSPNTWWMRSVVWLILILCVGLLATWVVAYLTPRTGLSSREIYATIWSITVLALLNRIKIFYQDGEKASEQAALMARYPRLEDLVGNDRLWADELVREQCAAQMKQIRDLASEIRSVEYKRGNTALALKLRNELESNAADCVAKVQNPAYGRTPYVSDLNVTRHAWMRMLDLDEDLLLEAQGLSGRAGFLQQKSHVAELTESLVNELNAEVSSFSTHFFERGHPITDPADDNQ